MSYSVMPGVSPTSKVIDKIDGTLLSVDGGSLDSVANYSQNDVLHTGIITFNDAFASGGAGITELVSIEVVEFGSILVKPDLRLYLFNDRTDFDITTTKNVKLDWGTVTRKAITQPIEIPASSGIDIETAVITPVTHDTYNLVNLNPARILKRYLLEYDLKAVLQYRTVGGFKFQTGATLQISLGVIRH